MSTFVSPDPLELFFIFRVSHRPIAYVFWSIFTSLAPSLFYFSVWKLAIAGHEASLISILSPCLLGIPQLRRFAFTHSGKVAFQALGFAGLFAYLCEDPLRRLGLVNFANVCICIAAVVKWSEGNVLYEGFCQFKFLETPRFCSSHHLVCGIGLIISSLSKLANHSNNPSWKFFNPSFHQLTSSQFGPWWMKIPVVIIRRVSSLQSWPYWSFPFGARYLWQQKRTCKLLDTGSHQLLL
jgi:hypothetical protein